MFIENFMKDDMRVGIRYQDNGDIEINLKDTCHGLGFTKTEKKSDKEYISIRWDRVIDYINDAYAFDHIWSKNDGTPKVYSANEEYIPEWIFYWLTVKANNDKAKKFQMWLTKDVLPSMRKHGIFIEASKDESKIQVLQRVIDGLREANNMMSEDAKNLSYDLAYFKEKAEEQEKEVAVHQAMLSNEEMKVVDLEKANNEYRKIIKFYLDKEMQEHCERNHIQVPTRWQDYAKLAKSITPQDVHISDVLLNNFN